MRVNCTEAADVDDVNVDVRHAWRSTGLDVVDGVLASTRRCTWCDREEHKFYGRRRSTWKKTLAPRHADPV